MSSSSLSSIPRARSTSSIVSFNDPEFESKIMRSFCDNDKDTIMVCSSCITFKNFIF